MKIHVNALAFMGFALTGSSSGIAGEAFFDAAKYHHTADGFRNPPGSPDRDVKPLRFIKFIYGRLTEEPGPEILPEGHLVPRAEALAAASAAPNPSLTWIGHASFLIRIGGLNILTDPFFSERASPTSLFGPKRYAPPGLGLKDLPKIDVIVISHNHYDSFDAPALEQLAKDHPKARVLVPLGLAEPVGEAGFTNVRQMDWYETDRVGGVSFQATPAIHRSNRGLFDINKSLWAGFVISGGKRRLWFAGDTGIGPIYEKQVAPRVGPVDIALVPIGAFLPRDFMAPVHTSPEEALEIARIMGARTAIGMHWGTLPLGEDSPKLGKQRFLAAPAAGIEKILMRIGETRGLGDAAN
ncbi:MAG: MBL fold metallo-hydrolase [Rhodospirillales bacterium]|jgi:L-ascorbate metabolism protein UlaG (beta-lactamase superfamily)|nr:MBL fold metallo-hydrolase [Rhodospirillales bacterium]MDP6646274.1 MBL fold metallo-hydrolase [Rhodospirillales bacterium]|tara:strand:+ start:1514 stop:2575 length:1062 start_codon:yes stop_codon:yes gene_type:complete